MSTDRYEVVSLAAEAERAIRDLQEAVADFDEGYQWLAERNASDLRALTDLIDVISESLQYDKAWP